MPKKCECGCGTNIPVVGRRFVRGHNKRLHCMLEKYKDTYISTSEKIKQRHKEENSPYSYQWKKKLSEASKNVIEKNKSTGQDKIIAKKISKSMKGNKNGCFITEETKIKRNLKRLYKSDDFKNKHPLFVKEEEIRDRVDYVVGEPGIEVRCKFCKKWFVPNRMSLDSRIRAIEYNLNGGGCYLYCSDDCKQKCSLFNTRVLTHIKPNHLRPTSSDEGVYRKEVLKRAEGKCEYCGEKATIVHHIKPFKLEPFFALDPDYGLAVCDKCNTKYAHKDECSTWKLADTICKG